MTTINKKTLKSIKSEFKVWCLANNAREKEKIMYV